MKKTLRNRILSLILMVIMILGLVPDIGMVAHAANIAITPSGVTMQAAQITFQITKIEFPNVEADGNVKQNGTTINIPLAEAYETVAVNLTATRTGYQGPQLNQCYFELNGTKIYFNASGMATCTITPTWVEGKYNASMLFGGKTYTFAFTAPEEEAPVDNITLDQTSTELYVGESSTLTATVVPADAARVKWVSSNETIATVDKGVVTAQKAGTVDITATAGDKSATCKVLVKNVRVTGLVLEGVPTQALAVRDTVTLTADIEPDNATIQNITWESDNANVATVDANGVVKAVAAGTAVISATSADNPEVKAQCTITVVTVAAEKIEVPETAKVDVGSTVTLAPVITPSNATNTNVIWESSDVSVATVKDGVVTGVSAGTATIKAALDGKTAECLVTVNPVSVTGISLNKTTLELGNGKSENLTVTFTPSNATNRNVLWTSSNPSVAQVDEQGKVTAKNEGTAIITATAEDGGFTAACTVTVSNYGEVTITTSCVKTHNYDAWMKSVTIKGPVVDGYMWTVESGHTESETHILNVRFVETVADDAEVSLSYVRQDAQSRLAGSLSGPASVKLVDGRGTATVTTKGYMGRYGTNRTYIINFTNKPNQAPAANSNTAETDVVIGETFAVDLMSIFSDPDGDALTYTLTKDGVTTELNEASYSEFMSDFGSKDYVFTAADSWGATVTYVVKVNVVAGETYDVKVRIPKQVTPTFCITKEINTDHKDVLGGVLTADQGSVETGFTIYSVHVPKNITRISVRGIDENNVSWGGMSIETKDSQGNVVTDVITMRQMQGVIKTLVNGETPDASQAIFKVLTTEGYYAVNGQTGVDLESKYLFYRFFLVASGNEDTYSYFTTAAGTLANTYGTNQSDLRALYDESASVDISPLPLLLKSAFTITAPEGADVKVYYQNRNYNVSEIAVQEKVAKGDMVDWVFIKSTTSKMSYRVSMEGKITKAGYISSTAEGITVTWSDEDQEPEERRDYDLTNVYGQRGDDSIILNVNERNNLVLKQNGSFTLKAYRVWNIIDGDTTNVMIEPDFTYQVLSGNDVISINPVSKVTGNAKNNWMTVKGLKEGTAILEVGYHGIDILTGNQTSSGGSQAMSAFTFNAVDPNRTGLVVVQVGNAATDVSFGIQCVSKWSGSAKKWDVEYDTLYFYGESGKLQLKPTVTSGEIKEVAVSHDKGNSWNPISGENGTYTAVIVPGNNILRVTKQDGTCSYQVVRGDKVSYTVTDADGDNIIEPNDTLSIRFSGLHAAVPKMAAVDNASQIKTLFVLNGTTTSCNYSQYNYPVNSEMTITVPSDAANGETLILTNGYTDFGGYTSAPGTHRSIPEAGLDANMTADKTTGARNLFEDIVLTVGADISIKTEGSGENTAPTLAEGVNATGNTAAGNVGEKYVLNLKTIFADAEKDKLTYKVSVNDKEAVAAAANYTYIPAKKGEYKLVFTANDGEFDSPSYTVILTAAKSAIEMPELTFNIKESEICGYVTISLEDNAIRLEDEMDRIDPIYQKPLGLMIAPVKVPFAAYDTIAEVTLRFFEAMEISASYTGTAYSNFYLSSIGNFVVNDVYYETMGEHDAGAGSGWMITWNSGDEKGDWFINKGASDFPVNDGDVIKWKYTCQYGADIGDEGYLKEAEEVEELIAKIDKEITLSSEPAILAARAAYDRLVPAQKAAVSNYDVLTKAEKALALLKATPEDLAAAKDVQDLIDAIGTVTKKSEAAIKKARAAYNTLTDLQKMLVDKDALETAENLYEQLVNSGSLSQIYEATGNYMASLGIPAVGTTGGEWMVIGLARGNKGLSERNAAGYYNGVSVFMEDAFDNNEVLKQAVRLDRSKSTENARVILGLTAAGYDATNVNGYNLFDGLNDMEYIRYQGINGPMWTLIALNAHPSYKDELKGNVTEEQLIDAILAAQLSDSGWDLTNQAADVDMTAMAIQALAPYYNSNAKVKGAVNNALAKLSSMQQSDGSFASIDGVNAESIAQVIVALTSLGINPEEDARFIKKGMSAVDALCKFAVENGGFKHTELDLVTGKSAVRDGMATEQGYYALVSYFRLRNGQTGLYNMSDVTLKAGKVDTSIPTAYDTPEVEHVEKLIDAIGNVDIFSRPMLMAIREAYEKLPDIQKKLVNNYQKLVKAESAYHYAAEEALSWVEEVILRIPHWLEITLETGSDIRTARKIYNMLPQYLRLEVDGDIYLHLLGAEHILRQLQDEALAKIKAGKLVLSQSELLEMKACFDEVTENTEYEEALVLLKTYYKLAEDQQLAFVDHPAMEILEEVIARENHEDSATGIQAQGLPWNIRMVIASVENEQKKEMLQDRLEDFTVLSLWDIYLEDILTNEKYTLEDSIQIGIPKRLLDTKELYSNYAILHEMADGKLEIFNCEGKDGYLVFDAVDFSLYAVLGTESAVTTEEQIESEVPKNADSKETSDEWKGTDTTVTEESDSNFITWSLLAAACVAVLVFLVVLKRKTRAV